MYFCYTFSLKKLVNVHMFLQVNRLQNEGYYGGVRLLMAICKVFHKYCKDHSIHLHERNFTLSYDTNIPRQVKLIKMRFFFKFSTFSGISDCLEPEVYIPL